MTWKTPPIIKVYEALGSLGDKRIIVDGNAAKVRSSGGTKTYDVTYKPEENAIRANDNASYWAGYLGYPSISFLLATGKLPYDPKLTQYLKGFDWKAINTRFKNDFAKSQEFIDQQVVATHGIKLADFHRQLDGILQKLEDLDLQKLPRTQRPPRG